jgi:serine protease Do
MGIMKHRVLLRWIPLSGVMGIGILVGLIVAGVWEATPAGLASDLVLEALRDPRTVVAAPASNVITEEPAVEAYTGRSGVEEARQAGLPSLREVAAAVRPAVVSVQVVRWMEGQTSGFRYLMPNIPEEWREFFPRFNIPEEEEMQPRRERVRGVGSGFIFSKDGYIITNNHVIDGATEVIVVLPDKRRYEADIVGADVVTDVAVIKIEAEEDLPTIPLGDSDDLEIGDWVLAIGNPLEFDYTVTAGIVSAKGRSLNIGPVDDRGARTSIQDFIQTDAAINRGNSGGPLVDLSSRVVGINTLIVSTYAGYGFAIPINLARTVARDLIEYGKVKRSWLGILFRVIDATDARARSLPDNPPIGALITEVTPGGSADDAGIESDDIILEVDGVQIDNSGKLQTLISTKRPGSKVEMLVYRGGSSRREGSKRTVTVTLQERPEDTTRPALERRERESDKLGLEVAGLERDQAREIEFDGDGVLVVNVEIYSPAADAGIVRGSVIVEVDGEPVSNVRGYERVLDELESGSYVMIRFYDHRRSEGSRYLTVTVHVR